MCAVSFNLAYGWRGVACCFRASRPCLILGKEAIFIAATYKNCPPVALAWLRYLELVQNRAAGTLQSRYDDIRWFLQFLRIYQGTEQTEEEKISGEVWVADMPLETIAGVTSDDVEAYVEYMLTVQHLSENTIYYRRLSTLRQFYDYLMRYQAELNIQLYANPVIRFSVKEVPARPVRALSPSEISRLLRSVQGDNGVRDYAIILLLATTGLTTAEVVKIRYTDYHEDVLFVAGRKVHLTAGTQKAIQNYIHQYREPIREYLKDNTLFVTALKRKRLSVRGLQNALQKHFDRAGIEGSARDLRHTAVMEMLKTAKNECERSYIAGYFGYTNIHSLDKFPLAGDTKDETMTSRLEQSWLSDLGLPKYDGE